MKERKHNPQWIISIRPPYGEQILTGLKKIEYRRASFRNVATPCKMWIWSCAPDKRFIGSMMVDRITFHEKVVYDDRKHFAVGDEVDRHWQLHINWYEQLAPNPVLKLEHLRRRYGFHPPRSHMTVPEEILDLLQGASPAFTRS